MTMDAGMIPLLFGFKVGSVFGWKWNFPRKDSANWLSMSRNTADKLLSLHTLHDVMENCGIKMLCWRPATKYRRLVYILLVNKQDILYICMYLLKDNHTCKTNTSLRARASFQGIDCLELGTETWLLCFCTAIAWFSHYCCELAT